jgi:uncharacterized membrane protein YcaP (DUF421 family)
MLEQFLLGSETWSFLPEVILRSLIGFVTVILAIKITGKRGVRQLSLFEIVIILTLGSAAGDIAFYKDVGILPAILTIICIVVFYRTITYILLKSRAVGKMVEGEAITIIENGRFTASVIKDENISFDEFYMELRQCGIEHLGQVRIAILEVNGNLSLYRNEGEEIKPGLHIIPDIIRQLYTDIPASGIYSCVHCGYTAYFEPQLHPCCPDCLHDKWGKASARGVLTNRSPS